MSDELKAELVELLPRLRRFAYALSGSVEEGDEVVQTACVKALARLDQFQPGTRLDSWMFRIVQTSWLDHVRSRKRREPAPEAELEALGDSGLGARRPEARLELEAVRAQMAALPDDQRAALALVAIEGLSYAEAAAALEVPVGTVMSRISRARARLLAARQDTARQDTARQATARQDRQEASR